MAMPTWQVNHLTIHREKLAGSITDIDGVVEKLSCGPPAGRILTDRMVEELMSHATKIKKARELLKILPKRGDKAFDVFYDVLIEANEGTAAGYLKPDSNRPVSSLQERPLPLKFPDDSDNPSIVNVQTCCQTPGNYMFENFRKIVHNPKHSGIYSMQHATRGLCVIINNEDFIPYDWDNRDGTQHDLDTLTKLFTQLHFKVEPHLNRKASEIKDIIKKYSKDTDHNNYDCFVMFVLSHGQLGQIVGVDGELVKIEQDIIQDFYPQNCKSLATKPKLFFIQACQGNTKDYGTAGPKPEENDVDMTEEIKPEEKKPEEKEPIKPLKASDEEEISVINQTLKNLKLDGKAEHADAGGEGPSRGGIFIAMATSPGFVAWRRNDIGTWFIQAVVYAFKFYSHCCNLSTLMTRVNNLVQSAETSEERNKQSPVWEASFNKEFYFFPGLINPRAQSTEEQHHPAQPTNYNQVQPSSTVI